MSKFNPKSHIRLNKKCRKCGADQWYKNRKHPACVPCRLAHNKKPKYKAANKAYQQTLGWREYLKGKIKEYQQTPKGRAAFAKASRKRRAAKLNAPGGGYTNEEFTILCQYFGNRCLACNKRKSLTADHIIPLSIGGRDHIDNIQPLCQSCNSSKGTKSTDYRGI